MLIESAIDQMVHYGYLDGATGDKLKSRDCCGIPKSIQNANTTERLTAPGDAEYSPQDGCIAFPFCNDYTPLHRSCPSPTVMLKSGIPSSTA